ncbi:MAG: DNA-3-methyladenine glycosylase 2 family protein [Alphaproteobacteria bacterium]|nr:DNA-3-methyladenine glycosylase 2 family protein [Alphaproteobacteria bacterium]
MAETVKLHLLHDAEHLADSVRALCAIDCRFLDIVNLYGVPSLRASQPGLESLLMIVCEQFLSLHAAAAIWERVHARLTPFSAAQVLAVPTDELLALGLSRAKARSFHQIAARVHSGTFDFVGLEICSEVEVRQRLCALPGVGPWTADIYLLSALQAMDAWPSGDLALRVAVQDLLKLESLPLIKDMTHHATPWRPYRAVAARLLWSHYRGLKGLKQA